MAGIVVSHGYRMTPEDHWYPHLADDLTKTHGHDVRVPPLPHPHRPRPEAWLKTLASHTHDLPAPQTVLVGHSLGGIVTLRLLEQHDPTAHGPFAGAVLVASPATDAGYTELSPFYSPGFAWPRIRRAARAFHVLHAADDPVTGADTPAHVLTWIRDLHATATLTPAGGHFPSPGGTCPRLPEAVRLVLRCLGTSAPDG